MMRRHDGKEEYPRMDPNHASVPEIAKVAVIGAGTMGWQIAALTAAGGRRVAIYDVAPGAAERAVARMRAELPGIQLPSNPEATAEDIFGRIRIAGSLGEAVADAELVIEAVREDLAVKRAVFAELDRLAPDAILATNSSSLSSAALVPAVSQPRRLLNLHFFAPVWQRSMLEIMSCGETSPDVLAEAERFGRSLGLVTATVRGDSKGFIINRVWRAVKRESLRVVDEGHASPEDVDRLWMIFFGTDAGPFGIMDMVGLDVVADIEASYAAVSPDPTDRPSPTLRRLIVEGNLGEKSGEGFYTHPHPAYRQPGWLRETTTDTGAEERTSG